MHRALFVCEILLSIFTHVDKFLPWSCHPRSSAWKSLAALARTCKPFHEPAMDFLWADIYEITPLLGCVTRLNQIIYRNSQYHWSSQDIEPLSEHEARQFLRHATHVRSLRVESSEHFHLLANLPIETCIFPSLSSLSFIVDHPHAKYLHLFLSPTLRKCSLSVIHPDFKYIATRFAALEDLSIKPGSFDDSIADDLPLLSNTVRLCKQLTNLYCPPLNWAAWRHISNLPTLLTVEISDLPRDHRWPLGRDTHNFAHFRNLTSLFFFVDTATYTIAVIQHSEFPSLQEFVITVRDLPYAEAKQLCRALSQCKANQNLERIEIISPYHTVRGPPSSVITQFFCFTQLRTLELDFPHCCFNLDNNLLLEAMASWPHISSLILVDEKTVPTVTFRGLFTALLQCPHLLNLDMSIDAVRIDIDPTAESFRHTTLELLNLTRCRVADAEAVARILFSMLPRINEVADNRDPFDSWDMNIDFLKQWEEVNRHLDLLNGREPRSSEFDSD
ncbi:hypothetical protein DFJ58DRAFT_765857 [Suillus subalutaceus]|uniref:uncharacterized protein n=1 Tax=Suillus subalutaceus TaxID=48586 RepID=UPI001B882F96|nr:uncharacterized protein DFJ58DRAFT_765857 [Suillus subalutaceus]KAG1869392.1 hypothetical protein DFJ58DRAFT_765857 [Suillus subalutaceus]